MPPRTIDNLGVDVSTRYAEDQKLLDTEIIKQSRLVPTRTEIDVSAPFFPSELDELLDTQATHSVWALFPPPKLFFEQRKRLFTHQMIPSMGSDEKKEAQMEKIFSKMRELEERKKEGDREQKDKKQQYEEERLLEEEEKEKKILTSLLNTITLYDKLVVEINSRRSQYHKG